MNKIFTKEALTEFVADIMEAAVEDECFSYATFADTEDQPFVIVAGWSEGFSPDDADLFCMSKSSPGYVMCVKIVVNDGPWAYADYECLNMPMNEVGEVDDTSIALEWDDKPEAVAGFLMLEWERLMEEAAAVVA